MKEVSATAAQAAALSSTYPSISFGASDVAKNVDPILRAKILADESYNPDQGNTVITQEIADRVTGLYIVGYEDNVANLKSLAGLEVFKNMTTLSVVAPNAQLEDVDLSAYTNLTTVTVSPSKGYKSIKLPAGIVNFTSVCSNAQSIGPVDLDLTAYTNLETVDVGGTSWGSGSKALVS